MPGNACANYLIAALCGFIKLEVKRKIVWVLLIIYAMLFYFLRFWNG